MKTANALIISLVFFLGACTTIVQSNPSRTATEELLISNAAERAAAELSLNIPGKAKAFIDSVNFEGTDSKYALGCIRTDLLRRGVRLTNDQKKANVIIEARAGALSIDRKSFLIGIPQFNIPIPLASAPLTFPEIAIYGTEEQKAVAKFAVTAYNVKDGDLVDAQDPQYGFSHNTKKTALVFITWTDDQALPKSVEKRVQ